MNLGMIMRISVLFVVCISTLTACQSSPRRAACESTDWYELGRRAGTTGQESKLEHERKRCDGSFDITSEAVYTNGYNNGLSEYCTADNGYSLGKAGSAANKVCPRPIDEAFLSAYAAGKKVRELEIVNETLDRRISSVSEKLKTAKEKNKDPEKNKLMSELTGLEQERQANQRRMSQIEKQVN